MRARPETLSRTRSIGRSLDELAVGPPPVDGPERRSTHPCLCQKVSDPPYLDASKHREIMRGHRHIPCSREMKRIGGVPPPLRQSGKERPVRGQPGEPSAEGAEARSVHDALDRIRELVIPLPCTSIPIPADGMGTLLKTENNNGKETF